MDSHGQAPSFVLHAQLRDDFVELNPAASASASTRVTNASQPALVLAGGRACAGDAADERSDAAARFEDARAFELGVDARDGVGVDAELDGELADGRQLIADLEASGRDGGAQSAVELRVNRRRIPWIDGAMPTIALLY